MLKNIKGFIRNSFFLSILLHLLILLSITTVILVKPEEQKKPPHLYIPSYVYKGSASYFKSPPKKPTPRYTQQAKQQKSLMDQKETDHQSTLIVNKKQQTRKSINHSQQPSHFSMWQASLASLQQEQINSLRQAQDKEKPVLLIGDLNQVADPIIKLMAQSLSAHFNYPETEGRLGIKGRVIIELVLHPEGHFTNINILKSSENHNFDAAALYAANTAPLVEGANRFLSKPTRFVIGFVFN